MFYRGYPPEHSPGRYDLLSDETSSPTSSPKHHTSVLVEYSEADETTTSLRHTKALSAGNLTHLEMSPRNFKQMKVCSGSDIDFWWVTCYYTKLIVVVALLKSPVSFCILLQSIQLLALRIMGTEFDKHPKKWDMEYLSVLKVHAHPYFLAKFHYFIKFNIYYLFVNAHTISLTLCNILIIKLAITLLCLVYTSPSHFSKMSEYSSLFCCLG